MKTTEKLIEISFYIGILTTLILSKFLLTDSTVSNDILRNVFLYGQIKIDFFVYIYYILLVMILTIRYLDMGDSMTKKDYALYNIYIFSGCFFLVKIVPIIIF